jgi:hypothetical protein
LREDERCKRGRATDYTASRLPPPGFFTPRQPESRDAHPTQGAPSSILMSGLRSEYSSPPRPTLAGSGCNPKPSDEPEKRPRSLQVALATATSFPATLRELTEEVRRRGCNAMALRSSRGLGAPYRCARPRHSTDPPSRSPRPGARRLRYALGTRVWLTSPLVPMCQALTRA